MFLSVHTYSACRLLQVDSIKPLNTSNNKKSSIIKFIDIVYIRNGFFLSFTNRNIMHFIILK